MNITLKVTQTSKKISLLRSPYPLNAMNVIKRWRTCHNKYTLCSENILQFMSDLFISLTTSSFDKVVFDLKHNHNSSRLDLQ